MTIASQTTKEMNPTSALLIMIVTVVTVTMNCTPDHPKLCALNSLHDFFFLSGFSSQTLTIHRTAVEGRGPSFIPLYYFHPLTNIETFICNFACEMTIKYFNRNACFYQTATRWDLPPYRITIWVIDWWCNVCLFTLWVDTRFLLQQFHIGNKWIWTRINYHPCITSEPTNQVY